ncbi:ParB N-terminal domain-containing protein [Phototrophicus methaneseepsis]|uniref:ParB N-terminal domain-containing protein n=1 Tax=Phototrophicus methaneseepsis TaxID=2710758 RepID=A0A7S8EA48_9CHLR|nr:ParB N-terminal domain-containing protein [Phototrophicus methaneseepsis]QPC83171.1 ParB N-terminal domain-containing protein [Phototrophicus methaneseepsis]
MARNKRAINTSLLDSVTADMLGGDDVDFFQDDSLRVERILLELVRPDPLQPRRVLPDRIYQAFHGDRMTPTQALRELIQTAQLAARQQGRPFNNVLDLLGNPDDESEQESQPLSPEEQLVHDLVNLAITIRDDGQVNPLTVVDVSEGVTRQFRIETGERRYWATWLLRDFISGYESDGMIPCIIIPHESASAFRQAKENTARSGLSAIAMARQAALLLLYVHGYEMPFGPVPVDFYRQALELDLRGKREYTVAIYAAMGGLDKKRFSRFKALLRLCDEAFEMADRHNVDEARLRYIIQLEPPDQIEMMRQIIQFDLTRKQVKDLIEKGSVEAEATSDNETISRPLMQLAKVMKTRDLPDPQSLATYLISQEQNVNLARARIQTLRELLDQAEQFMAD